MPVLKKIALMIVSLILLLFIALAVIPFFVDVDQYRKPLVDAVNEQIEGELSIENLSMSLWGKVEIEINALNLKLPDGETLVAADTSYLNIPFSALFQGQPQVLLRLTNPTINVKRDAAGNLNVMKLLPEAPKKTENDQAAEEAPSPADGADTAPPTSSMQSNPLLGLILASDVDILIEDANLAFVDEGMKLNQKLSQLNLRLEDIGFKKPIQLTLWSDVKTKLDSIDLNGPIRIEGQVVPKFSDFDFQSATVDLKVDLDKLRATVPDVLTKSEQTPLNLSLQATVSPQNIDLKQLKVNALSWLLAIGGQVTLAPELAYNIKLTSEPLTLARLGPVVVPLAGLFHDDLTMQLAAELETEYLKSLTVKLRSSENNELDLNGSLRSFQRPDINLLVESSKLDLARFLNLPEPAPDHTTEQTEAKQGAGSGSSSSATPPAAEPAVDIDAKLAELRDVDMLRQLQAELKVSIVQFLYDKIKLQDLGMTLRYQNLVAELSQFAVKAFQGELNAAAKFDLKPSPPTYELSFDTQKIEFKSAVETFLTSFANTVSGELKASAKGEGSSLNADQMLQNLSLNGHFMISDATLQTIDVNQILEESVQKAVNAVKEKFPELPLGKLKNLKDLKGSYKAIQSSFAMKQAVMHAPDFHAEPFVNKGVDIKGDTKIDLAGDGLQANWRLIDTFNKTGLMDVDIKQGAVAIDSVLAEPGQPVYFPVTVGCKLSSPCYRYEEIPLHFIRVASKNIERKLKGKARELAQKKLEEAKKKAQEEAERLKKMAEEERKKKEQELKDKAKDKVKDLLKDKKLPF